MSNDQRGAPEDAPNRQPTILIVDDFSDIRVMLRTMLLNKGFSVVEAANGEEAVAEALRSLPDLILMDLSMPKMGGVEAIMRIRKVPGLADIPVFVISAHATEDLEIDAIMAGATEVITKPINTDIVLEKIQIALEMS